MNLDFKVIVLNLILLCAFMTTANAYVIIDSADEMFAFTPDVQPSRSVDEDPRNLCEQAHNNARAMYQKAPIQSDYRLESVAQIHNQVMISQNCFNPRCPGESDFGDRVTNSGYNWMGLGESIAAGNPNCSSVMATWMNLDQYRGFILGDFQNVGCAFTRCSSCSYPTFWTCIYANQA